MHNHDRLFFWRFLPLVVAALLVLAAVQPGCKSTGEPDWPAITRELDLTANDLETLSQTATTLGKASTAEALLNASQAVREAHDLIAAGGDPTDAWGTVDAALDVLEAVAAKEENSDLALGVAAAKIVLGRVKAYIPEPVETGPIHGDFPGTDAPASK